MPNGWMMQSVWSRAPALAAQHHCRGREVILRFLFFQLTSPDCQNCRDEGNKNMGLSSIRATRSKERFLTTKRKVFASFAQLLVSELNLAQALVLVTIRSNWIPHQKTLIALCRSSDEKGVVKVSSNSFNLITMNDSV